MASVTWCRTVFPALRTGNGYTAFLVSDITGVLVTGGALIGDAVPPVDERSRPKPLSPYGTSKLAGEGYAHAFAKA